MSANRFWRCVKLRPLWFAGLPLLVLAIGWAFPSWIGATYVNLGALRLLQGVSGETPSAERNAELERASHLLSEAEEWSRDNPRVYRLLGILDVARGDYQHAVGVTEQAVRLGHDDLLATYELGSAQWAAGEKDLARQAWRVAGALDSLVRWQYEKGLRSFEAGDVAAAETAWRKAVDLDPGFFAGYYALGGAYWGSNRMDDAQWAFQQAIQARKGPSREGYRAEGQYYLLLREWDSAAHAFESALAFVPRDAETRTQLGFAFWQGGHVTEAVDQLETALALAPEYLYPYLYLGHVYVARGEYGNALQMYLRASRVAPDSAEAHAGLGREYHRQGLMSEAIQELTLSVRLEPANEWYHLSLANAYRDSGGLELAIQEYRRTLELHPDESYAARELDRLLSR